MLDEKEFRRWIESSRRTLQSATRDAEAGDYNWACFKAHQAAEKALKALLWGCGKPAYGHMLPKLLDAIERELSIEVPTSVKEACSRLNKLYTPTRYPDVWTEGIPEDYYTRSEADEAINLAKSVIEWVEGVWLELLRSAGGSGSE